jgi:hypothetical protein
MHFYMFKYVRSQSSPANMHACKGSRSEPGRAIAQQATPSLLYDTKTVYKFAKVSIKECAPCSTTTPNLEQSKGPKRDGCSEPNEGTSHSTYTMTPRKMCNYSRLITYLKILERDHKRNSSSSTVSLVYVAPSSFRFDEMQLQM